MYQNRPSLKLSLKLSLVALMAVGGFMVFGLFHPLNGQAAAGINQQLNFQGRLLDNTGAVVPDGTYNMEFKIYQDGTGCVAGGTSPCGGTLKWTEDWIQTNRVTVKNGYFSVDLGSLTAFGTNIDWNQNTLWLSTNIGGVTNTPTPTWDGEMTPFKRMASSPYSLNSNALQGLQAINFVQLAQGIQADTSTTNPSIFINKTGATANIVELQKSNTDVFTIANSGDITATGKYNTDTISSSAITFGAASTANIDAGSGQTLQIGASSAAVTLGANTTVAAGKSLTANGSVLFENSANSPTAFQIQSATAANTLFTADTNLNKVVIGDATGTAANTTQLVVDSSTVDPTTGYNGAIYYNSTSNKFRCYQSGAWADCLAASGNSIVTYTGAIINQAATATATPVVSNTYTAATTFTVAGAVSTFTAPAAGSFRACQVIGDANATAGTASLRWRVNGASVGAAACVISTTNNHVNNTALDDGVVTFSAGDTIGVAMDSATLAPAASTDYTVLWSVEYNSVNTAPSGATLQSAYNNGPTITTADAHDFVLNAADTTTDSNLLFNLQCVTTCSTNGRFAVQNAGADVFTVSPNSGGITLAPSGAGDVVMTGDNDSNLSINSTFTGTGPTQNAVGITLTDNATAAGTSYGLNVTNADNGANAGVPSALAHLANANAGDTVPDGLQIEQTGAGTLTNGIEVKQTAGTVTNGLTFTGTFGSILKVGATTVINGAGQIAASQITGAIPFANIGAGTSTGALVVGTGGSLTTSGTGTISATGLSANYVASVANGTGLTGGAAGSNAAALTLGIDQTASLTWTGTEAFNGATNFTPGSSNDVTFTGDNDSSVAINSTFTGTGPTQDGLAITLTDNATAAGTSYGLSVTNADNTTNVGVPAALAYLKNANAAETVADGLLVEQIGAGTLSNGLEVKQTSGAVTNGLTFTGTFAKLINSTNFNVTGAGAGTFASTLTVNGTTFSLGNGTASTINTPSGNAGLSIIPNGSGALNLATSNTGNVAVGNTTGSFSLTSNGGLNVTTGGALTGVASLDTINTSANALTFTTATGTVSSAGGSDLVLNSQLTLRPGVDASNGLTIQNAAATATIASFGTNTSNLNLIANPSLEANANGWVKKGTGPTVTSSDDFAQYGKRSLKIVTTATAVDGASYAVPLKASTQYTLSAWMRLSTGTATTINLNRQDNGADVDTGTGNCTAISVTAVFAQYTCTFTTGATVNGTSNVYIKQTDAPVGGRTIYVDGVTLVAGASGLTFDAGGSSLNVQTSNNSLTLNGTDSGDVQPWQVSSTPLTTALRYGDGIQANGYVYYVGGCTGACGAGTSVATVYYAKMNADGSMGGWTTASNPLPAARYGLTTYASNGYLYAVGGDSGAGVLNANPQSTVYYSKLNGDGSVGIWQTSVNTLPAAREFHTSAITNGFAYVIGGDNAGAQSTAYYAKMYADGSTSTWQTTTALTTGAAARREATTVTANGNIYVIGGDTGGTAQTTVYYNTINSDGTLGTTWNTTTALNVGGAQPRRFLTSIVANGYVYAIGGDNGTAAQTTVYYAHLLPDGTVGAWQAATNPLPAGRYGSDSVIVNGYIYEIGGYDGTNPQATPYYASTARILIGGSLDLVGLGGGSISASAGAGSITAGSIRAVGGLIVDGSGDFNNGLSVDSIINLNAVSANAGQTVFNINNLNSNSIFSVRHMNTNFGALATTGAFMSKNSYFGEEYNVGHNSACSVSTTVGSRTQGYARGDGGNAGGTLVCSSAGNLVVGAGELNFSNVIGASSSFCTASSPGATTANGVEQIVSIGSLAAGSKALCAENIASTATTSSKIYSSTNLPVVEMKVKPTTTAASNNTVIVAGMGADDVAATTNVLPTTGIFFTNCSTYSATVPSGCSNTTWYGMASGGSAQVGATQTCSAAMTANFAYLRIEVRATNDVHFFVDADTTNGISETECGTGITTTVNAGAMSMWVAANSPTAGVNATTTLQVDYFRSWQDDNVGLTDDTATSAAPTAADPAAADQANISAPPLTPINTEMDDSSSDSNDDDSNPFSTLTDFVAATSEDTVFNNNIYVKGTIFADKIVANQIEGMDVITDQIKSLSDEVAKEQAANPATSKTGLSGAGGGKVNFTTASIANLTVMAQFEAKGGLMVDGDAQFNGKTLFQLAAEFNGPATFNGQVTYNSDAGGTAIIHDGDQKVSIKFGKEYTTKPIIIANWLLNDTKDSQGNTDTSDEKQQRLLDGGYSYSVANVTTKGFDIILNKKASEDVDLSWIANAIKNAQISQSNSGSSN